MALIPKAVKALLQKVLGFLYPPTCLLCHQMVDAAGQLCVQCWPRLKKISPPFCLLCSVPLEIYMGDNDICASCLESERPWGRVRAAFIYNEAVRQLVLRFKAHGNIVMGYHLAHLMYAPNVDFVKEHDLIVPVPLHWRRLLRRGFNQAAILAKYIGKWSKIPIDLDALKRKKHTSFLAPFGAKERFKIVGKSIVVSPKKAPFLKGKRILLLDDVMSSGATITACIKVLQKSGVKEVDVLVLSRPHLNKI